MQETIMHVKPGAISLTNSDMAAVALERVVSGQRGLPKMMVFYGPAGWGKTTSGLQAANTYRGYFVTMRSVWTRKTLLQNILVEMGICSKGTLGDLLDKVTDQLLNSGRPLIIDEADHCTRNDSMPEMIRDICDESGAPILLIGMEGLPDKLKSWEQFHSRCFFQPAQPANLADAIKLAGIYCDDVEVGEDLLAHLVTLARGSVRRISTNLSEIREQSLMEGWSSVDLNKWGNRPLFVGDAPRRRV